ncbi:MAG: SDR family oxidoreductase [Bryobacteraceae bacterium]|nr:SDR family oxidoreductase [Bryobacteraceae bacterium]
MLSFRNKGVLVTGAGRGVGKRLAIGFAAAGARVGLLARSKAELDLCDLEIEHGGGTALRIRADVTDYEQMCAAAERMKVTYGGLHVLICAAGVMGPVGPLADNSPRQWWDAMQTNTLGVVHSVKAVLPWMIENRTGKIVVLLGAGAAGPRANLSAYACSKAALARLVETLAEEVLDHNIQVNGLDPGETYTHQTDELLRAGERAGWREMEEAQRVRASGGISAQKQIDLAMFLASEQSNHVTGRFISVEDDWRRLRTATIDRDLYTLRRMQRAPRPVPAR